MRSTFANKLMSHFVTAVIAKSPVVEQLLRGRSLVAVDLRDGWILVPIDDDDLDSFDLDFSQVQDGFTYLSQDWDAYLTELSRFGSLAYIETEYFGGMGTQGATVFDGGKHALSEPAKGEGAINLALKCLGVSAAEGIDEFDYIGLSRYRHTCDWKEAAS